LLIDLSYLDRINVSNARLAGMQDDCGMTDVEWSAGISLFYVGYIISQVPANVIIAKGKPKVLMPCIMLAWSAVTIAMPAVSSPAGFMVCRFLVGIAEGSYSSSLVAMMLTCRRPLRTGCGFDDLFLVH
jgi:MFS family permease